MEFLLNGKRYEGLKFLGKGKGGYSYLVTDGIGRYTLKKIHHEPCDYYTFGDKLGAELRDYARLKAVGIPMPELLAVDREQELILKEYIDGPTIYELVRQERMIPDYYHQVRAMCAKLYPAGLNIDYFPTNFIVQAGKLFYIDYECNAYMERWDFDHWGNDYWWRSPAFLEYVKAHGGGRTPSDLAALGHLPHKWGRRGFSQIKEPPDGRLNVSKRALASPYGRGGPRQRVGEGAGFSSKIQKYRIFAKQIFDKPSQSCLRMTALPKGEPRRFAQNGFLDSLRAARRAALLVNSGRYVRRLRREAPGCRPSSAGICRRWHGPDRPGRGRSRR